MCQHVSCKLLARELISSRWWWSICFQKENSGMGYIIMIFIWYMRCRHCFCLSFVCMLLSYTHVHDGPFSSTKLSFFPWKKVEVLVHSLVSLLVLASRAERQKPVPFFPLWHTAPARLHVPSFSFSAWSLDPLSMFFSFSFSFLFPKVLRYFFRPNSLNLS